MAPSVTSAAVRATAAVAAAAALLLALSQPASARLVEVDAATLRSQAPLGFQPNIVFILTDDQDTRLGQHDYTDLGSMEAQPVLMKELIEGGARFANAKIATPICCPSRTETFTGRYYHNVGPPNVEGSCMHVNTSETVDPVRGMFPLMRRAGYITGVFGKVTNDQGNILNLATKLDSMDYIDSPLDYNDYFGMTYFRKFPNGTNYIEKLDAKNPIFGTPYQTTQIGNRTLRWLDMIAGDGKPFFAYIGPHAPHYPAEPAPWYQDAFEDHAAPVTVNWNLSSPDKAQHVRQNPPFTEAVKCWEDQHFRDRWKSLLSVDDLIRDVVAKLSDMGVLDKTFIVYSSDHGYKLGQWRIGTSKQHPYETDISIPFLIRGPGVKTNSTFSELVGNVDIMPTLLELSGGASSIPGFVDGKSLVPVLLQESAIVNPQALQRVRDFKATASWRQHYLVAYKSVGTYFNDHSNCWSPPGKSICNGQKMPRGPTGEPRKCVEDTGVGTGNCYFVDSTHSNNWRLLRIMSDQENLAYVEYDPAFTFNVTDPSGSGLQHYELYDVDKDPYQMHNLYSTTDAATRTRLHGMLADYFQCGGTASSPSNCP